jgi:hypothetical protein
MHPTTGVVGVDPSPHDLVLQRRMSRQQRKEGTSDRVALLALGCTVLLARVVKTALWNALNTATTSTRQTTQVRVDKNRLRGDTKQANRIGQLRQLHACASQPADR